MKQLGRALRNTIFICCTLLCSCNWLDNKTEQAEQKISEEFEQHVLDPISEEIHEIAEAVFNPPYDSVAANAYCAELRPNPLRIASLQDIPEIGYQYSVLANTPDSVLSHVDASFFEARDHFFPIKFPYFLEYSGETLDYFRIEAGYCQYSNLPQFGIVPYKEIFQLSLLDPYLMIASYDDDLSFMSPTKQGIVYYIINLNKHQHFEYSRQEDFDLARRELTNSDDSLMNPSDFIAWYESYRPQNSF